ncbi:hypothetical protein HBB16_10245 [Pseudonocardia sp. MCCB 268]|nr:hypothetical protein [Pseudonocardia cytotoxica]
MAGVLIATTTPSRCAFFFVLHRRARAPAADRGHGLDRAVEGVAYYGPLPSLMAARFRPRPARRACR